MRNPADKPLAAYLDLDDDEPERQRISEGLSFPKANSEGFERFDANGNRQLDEEERAEM